jgi:hypothetical protein
MIENILNKFGYYKINQLSPIGNCGCCGKSITQVLLKGWVWGLCEECSQIKG